MVVYAANGGRPNRPGWYYNLLADPAATVEIGTESLPVVAELAQGADRQRLWDKQVAVTPFLADFAVAVPWEIPVFVLVPAASESRD